MNKYVSSMELLSLLHKSDYSHTSLSLAERAVLSVILCYVNGKLENGYEAWPSTDIIMSKTGLSTTGIGKCRKTLVANGWIEIVSGRKAGVANHYFVNAKKVIEVAVLSGANYSGKPIAVTASMPAQPKQHERSGSLRQGQKLVEMTPTKVPPVTKPVVQPYNKWIEEEDPDCPF